MSQKWYILNTDLKLSIPYPFITSKNFRSEDSFPQNMLDYRFRKLSARPLLDSMELPSIGFLPDVLTNTFVPLANGIVCTENLARIIDGSKLAFDVDKFEYVCYRGSDQVKILFYHFRTISIDFLYKSSSSFVAYSRFRNTERYIDFLAGENVDPKRLEIILAKELTIIDCTFDVYAFGIHSMPLIVSEDFVTKLSSTGIKGISWQQSSIVRCL